MPSPGSWNNSNNSQHLPVDEIGRDASGARNGQAALRAGIARLASHDWSKEGDVEHLRATVEALIRLLADSGIVDEKVLGYRIEAALAEFEGHDPDNVPTAVLPSASRPIAAHGEIEAAAPRRMPRASTAPGFAGPIAAAKLAQDSAAAEFPLTDEIPTLEGAPAAAAQGRTEAVASTAVVNDEMAARGLALIEPAPAVERPAGPPLQPSKPVARFNPKAPTINTPAPAPRPVAPRVMRPAAVQAAPVAVQAAPVAAAKRPAPAAAIERPAATAGATPNPAASRAIARITPRARPAVVSRLPGMPARASSESDDVETLARPALPVSAQPAASFAGQPEAASHHAPTPASLDDSWTDLMPPRLEPAAPAAVKAQPAPAPVGPAPAQVQSSPVQQAFDSADVTLADFAEELNAALPADFPHADLAPAEQPAPAARPAPRPARTTDRRRGAKKRQPPRLFKSIMGTRTGELPTVIECAGCGRPIQRWKRNETDRGSLCNRCFDAHVGA